MQLKKKVNANRRIRSIKDATWAAWLLDVEVRVATPYQNQYAGMYGS